MINVDVNSDIRIKFNSDINTGTIIGNFTVLEDPQFLFTTTENLSTDRIKYNTVQGAVSYEDKTLIFKPNKPLNENSRYLVLIRAGGILDILGRTMLTEYVGTFYTEINATLPKAEFLTPKFGVITSDVPEFTWGDQQSKAYVFQLSSEDTFETLLVDEIIKSNTNDYAGTVYRPLMLLTEGLYYVRVRAINGNWSEPLQFFIKNTTEAVVTSEDVSEKSILEELDAAFERPLEILEMFPPEGAIQVDTKVNIVYLKVAGKLTSADIEFDNTFVTGDLFDLEDEGSINPHGVVSGKWEVVNDLNKDVTYIIFTPDAL
jgi:hypothetical protein